MAVPEPGTTGPRPAPPGDPGGPVLALCLGQRCSALRSLAGSEGSVPALQRTVRDTPGAVLVTAGCLGSCALAAVAAVAHRDGVTGRPGPTLWLSGVQEPPRAEALAGWIQAGGPPPGDAAGADLPPALVEAVAGVGPPMRLGVPAR